MIAGYFALLTAGLLLVIFGSDFLVDGASCLARKLKISEFVIGLTVVGFGTSCPELVVSITGSLNGSGDIAIGNVVGSNIFNVLLILALTALVSPVAMSERNRKTDIPITLAASVILAAICIFCNSIGRFTGLCLLVIFAIYLWHCFKNGGDSSQNRNEDGKTFSVPVSILLCAGGLAGLVFGGKLFVQNAVGIAQHFGLSEKFIAITLLAGGTSLPELVTCIVAACKGKDQLALGNILGSNVFNILLIIGMAALVRPFGIGSINLVDLCVMVFSALLLLIFAYTLKKNRLDRPEGALMLLLEAAYITFLFLEK